MGAASPEGRLSATGRVAGMPALPLASAHATLSAATIFLSAFLLFQVQPMVAKAILPWFGGTPGVWSTCLLCFQLLLLVGYLYAHALLSHCPPRLQPVLHGALVLTAVASLHLAPERPADDVLHADPGVVILGVLARHVALPYFVLATTAPLVHALYERAFPTRSPYRLYALSNAGSLLALVSYPFVVEPVLALPAEFSVWSAAFVVYAAAVAAILVTARWGRAAAAPPTAVPVAWPARDRALTFLLAASGTAILLALTNHLCHDVATVPFLWIVPLALYLLTFILCFESDRWYARRMFSVLTVASIAVFSQGYLIGAGVHLLVAMSLSLLTLFTCCMTCHGELARLRPAGAAASAFYLTLSAGGAAGGLFVGLVAPHAFNGYYEVPIAFVGVLSSLLVVHCLDDASAWSRRRAPLVFRYAVFGLVGFALAVSVNAVLASGVALEQTRNFYGVLRVLEKAPSDPARHQLLHTHGRIVHGAQFRSPEKAHLPTEYYGEHGGIGQLLVATEGRPRRIGVIGLGVGVLAAYGRAADEITYYEINPDVIAQAQRHFTFLRGSAARIAIVEGDARLTLEQAADRGFDILAVDAFSGDSIPAHLLTAEAFALYRRHLAPAGVLAVNISNRHLDLRPIVWANARRYGWHSALVYSGEEPEHGTVASEWALLAAAPAGPIARRFPWLGPEAPHARLVLWTDQFSNLFSLLRRGEG